MFRLKRERKGKDERREEIVKMKEEIREERKCGSYNVTSFNYYVFHFSFLITNH